MQSRPTLLDVGEWVAVRHGGRHAHRHASKNEWHYGRLLSLSCPHDSNSGGSSSSSSWLTRDQAERGYVWVQTGPRRMARRQWNTSVRRLSQDDQVNHKLHTGDVIRHAGRGTLGRERTGPPPPVYDLTRHLAGGRLIDAPAVIHHSSHTVLLMDPKQSWDTRRQRIVPSSYPPRKAGDACSESFGRGPGFAWDASDGVSSTGMLARCEAKFGPGNCEMRGALAYPICRNPYRGGGGQGKQNRTPSRQRQRYAGDACSESFGRGGGFLWDASDGLGDGGMFRRCEAKFGPGNCEKRGAVVYPICRNPLR